MEMDIDWPTWTPLKVKLFLWLAFLRRHWTADRRLRHGLQSHKSCMLCEQEDETMEHMLIWWPLLQQLDFTTINPGTGTLQDWWMLLRAQLAGGKRKGFDSLFALTSWQIWKERNARVFRDICSPSSRQVPSMRLVHRGTDTWAHSSGASPFPCPAAPAPSSRNRAQPLASPSLNHGHGAARPLPLGMRRRRRSGPERRRFCGGCSTPT
ncbi:hypothetical protein HU200_033795 [Digitaria exilis]|uniref:Reverse transcriptase zinc-binding domain-containing protein n=1 Tax=Digitaria exilis TaxID=1010633 RepID=A0A835BWL9_9POAL|nr:hypothetical protein HU200_033795 [Digitaria exilis]